MKNQSNASTAINRILIVSLILIVLLPMGSAISCKTETPPPAETTDVTIAGFSFQPAEITVPVGSTVTWTNQDSVIHTVTARDGTFDSGNLSHNETFSHTFQESGTFEYYCTIHTYMEGKVIVE
jgi:amicyanin